MSVRCLNGEGVLEIQGMWKHKLMNDTEIVQEERELFGDRGLNSNDWIKVLNQLDDIIHREIRGQWVYYENND